MQVKPQPFYPPLLTLGLHKSVVSLTAEILLGLRYVFKCYTMHLPWLRFMFFKQVQQHGDNFSYIIADDTTREAAVVDSSFNAGEITRILKAEKLNLKYVINTHGHSDHTAGNTELLSAFEAVTVAHKLSRIKADIKVDDGDIIRIGAISVKAIHTPGHTPDGMCLLVDNQKLLTGDTLFVGECGRTDLPGGNSKKLYDSLFNKILKLDDNVEVYPGHDYGSTPSSTIGEEKRSNYTLEPRTPEEFINFMNQP
jgi:glyoxylase-like metal-dependent hydrolase (beta-lactamase superfamily II)